MPRAIRSSDLETRTARLKLPKQGKPFWVTASPGVSLGYRRGAGSGTWNVRAADGKGGNWVKSFAIADDYEDSDGENVLTYWQAQEKARKLARGGDADAGRPVTVAEALDDYADDLAGRGGGAVNAHWPRRHLPPSLMAKPVSLLTVKELRHWRNALPKVMKASSVNRLCKGLKACFSLAASHDDRITNSRAWTIGLAALAEHDTAEKNIVLTDAQVGAVVAAAYDIGPEFGLYVEVHAATGQRSGQLALLDVGDLQIGREPRLMIPSSLKGKNRKARTRKPFPISLALAQTLKRAAAGRGAGEPLLLNMDGKRWGRDQHYFRFAEAAKAAKLPDGASIYSLRHTQITKALLMGVAVRLVASSFDTSIAMIEKTYSKHIADHGDAQMRRALCEADTAGGNVVALR